jgi:hypothetical protein
MSAFEASLVLTGELEALHIRNGLVIDRRISAPREPSAIRAIKDPFYRLALIQQMTRDLFDPGIAWARNLLHRAPKNLVTTAGVDYMASNFGGSGNISNFNYHDCGTGKLSGSAQTTINGATNASPIVIAVSSAHGLTTNDLATIASVGGNTNANADWQISVVDTTHFNLIGSSGNSAYTSGGSYARLNGAGDTALVTAAGTARVSGTQSNPSANQYKSIATISFTSSLSIVEWGLFSASSSGTLWDRRWFNTSGAPATTATGSLTASAIGVNSGDSIQFTYTLTINAGGS